MSQEGLLITNKGLIVRCFFDSRSSPKNVVSPAMLLTGHCTVTNLNFSKINKKLKRRQT